MASPVLITRQNRISSNQFVIKFPSTIDLNGYECGISSGYIYYSWYSISSALNNNRLQLTVPSSSGSTTYDITVPDGAYNVTDLNNFLQYWFVQNGIYLKNNTDGTYLYYASFQLSPTSYSIQFITTALPTSLPSGFTSGGMTFPASSNQSIQLTILSNNQFNEILGYNVGTYPPAPTISSTYTKDSDIVPNVNPIQAVQIRLSCLYNEFSANNQLLHVFTNSVRFGALIDISTNSVDYVNCQGIYREVILSLYDQKGRPLVLLDPNVAIKLLFRKRV
jgi:hypothetical protein